jgi:cytidylate kinase
MKNYQHATQSDGTPSQVPAAIPPERKLLQAVRLPALPPWLAALPADFVVAIDGPARTGKNTAGALVAEAIGGVLVDSGRFYRALTKAALAAGVNLDCPPAVVDFCCRADLRAQPGFDGNLVQEALALVQGVCFRRADLEAVAAQTARLAHVSAARQAVNDALRAFAVKRRLVVLGRDMGARVFADAPLKVFLTAPLAVLEQRQVQSTGAAGVHRRVTADQPNTLRTVEALEIDTARHTPDAVRDIILAEIRRRMGSRTQALLPST